MKATVWGARGSIPVSGREYVRYGGDSTCVEMETAGGEAIILDAGSGLRPLGNKFMKEKRDSFHFFLTHAHWDHLLGFPFFKPLYQKSTTFYIHGCAYAQESLRAILQDAMRPPFFPVRLEDVTARLVFDDDCRGDIETAGVRCQSFPLSHPNNGYGFRFTEGERSLAFFPDNELTRVHPGGRNFEEYAEFLRGVNVLLHDAEFLPDEYERFSRGWGHSVYLDTIRLAIDARADRLVMWHLNQDRPDDEVDTMLDSARSWIQDSGKSLKCDMAYAGMSFEV